mmetsp:Transcript_16773/g.50868  ORF Transcript_16773/g.50868 Transcript_16773/m.50868 type:complete len:228 (-) Transcript_16773:1515-2198(-)
MRRYTRLARSSATRTSRRSDLMSTTSAASMATCVPPPTATPTSATARAGESLMPSPTIATIPLARLLPITFSHKEGDSRSSSSSSLGGSCVGVVTGSCPPLRGVRRRRARRRAAALVSCWRSRTKAAFSAGSTPALTCSDSRPTCLATASAVRTSSPVSILTSTSKKLGDRRSAIVRAASGRGASATATNANGHHASSPEQRAARTTVLASARSASTAPARDAKTLS